MNGFEVLERGDAAQVKRVLAYAEVAGPWPLTARDVCESVLDGDTLAEPVATARCSDETPKPLLESFVRRDADLASTVFGFGALRSHGAPTTRRAIEANRRAELE